MSAAFVATTLKEKSPDGWPAPHEVVAITDLQQPRLAGNSQDEANAEFIAAARAGVPRICHDLEESLKRQSLLVELLRMFLEPRGPHDEARSRTRRLLANHDATAFETESADLRTLADNAAAGPWHAGIVEESRPAHLFSGHYVAVPPYLTSRWPGEQRAIALTRLVGPHGPLYIDNDRASENAAFIAAIRTDVPRLYDAVGEVQTRCASMTEAIGGFLEGPPAAHNLDRARQLLAEHDGE